MNKKTILAVSVFVSLAFASKAFPCGGAKNEHKAKESLFSPAVAIASDVEEKTIKVSGMTCSKCSKAVEKAVKKVDGVIDAKADHKAGICKVKMKAGTDVQKILIAIKDAGYEPAEN
ncbi:MAG: cation transporter [Candidatus Calescibacterium sp.]|nr:cation transporter [Candidatus Calescibacterium sp.]MCX7733803.1 cation transporter [bacterium]MDW8086991.1 heavy metal-associated domain-containing protein [Candidatus Calescibacterium sp.]